MSCEGIRVEPPVFLISDTAFTWLRGHNDIITYCIKKIISSTRDSQHQRV